MKMLSAWFNTYLWTFPRGGLGGIRTRSLFNTVAWPVMVAVLLGVASPMRGSADDSKSKGVSTTEGTPKAKDAAAGKEADKAKEKAKKKKKKEKSTISLHLETNPDPSGRSMEVTVLRSTPMQVTILKEPIVTENHLIAAKLMDEVGGGFSIQLQFDSTGRLLLENYSASQRGKRLVVFSDFGQRRYIGMKKMTSIISDGRFTFSPDASREEAERILSGLERVAKENVKRDKW